MKFRSLAIIGFIIAVILIISCKTHFETTKSDYKAVATRANFEHGKNLVFSICAGCHYNRGLKKLAGNPMDDVPGIAGKVYSANLTQSKTNGIAPKYTDAQLKYLLKTGISRDGRFMSYMLRPNMADEDINDIIVFLRSDDPAVSAADTTVGLTHYSFIGKAYLGFKADPAPYKSNVKRPSDNDPVALGRYLVDNVGCYHCHSKSLKSLNSVNPEQTKGYLAGGATLKGEQGSEIAASNITPDKNTGIGNYTKEDFRRALKEGRSPTRTLRPPMEKFDHLSDKEVDAIYAYLMTVPPKYHAVKHI
ncbi:MAG: cytochrome c [Bacteroidota bacterium]|nr:cytochrome c [Bacteroidota bacterium]